MVRFVVELCLDAPALHELVVGLPGCFVIGKDILALLLGQLDVVRLFVPEDIPVRVCIPIFSLENHIYSLGCEDTFLGDSLWTKRVNN